MYYIYNHWKLSEWRGIISDIILTIKEIMTIQNEIEMECENETAKPRNLHSFKV